MMQEYGPYTKRKTCRLFVAWVRLAGASVRGWHEPTDKAEREEQMRQDAIDNGALSVSFQLYSLLCYSTASAGRCAAGACAFRSSSRLV